MNPKYDYLMWFISLLGPLLGLVIGHILDAQLMVVSFVLWLGVFGMIQFQLLGGIVIAIVTGFGNFSRSFT